MKINEWKKQTRDKENFIGQSLWRWLCVQRQERGNQTIQPKRRNRILTFYETAVVSLLPFWRCLNWSLLVLSSFLSITKFFQFVELSWWYSVLSASIYSVCNYLNVASSNGEREDGMDSSYMQWPPPPKMYGVPTLCQLLSDDEGTGMTGTRKVPALLEFTFC